MRPDPLILAFDTSAAHCAAALLAGDHLLAEVVEPMDKGQAERLLPMLTELLASADVEWSDLSAIGVGIGPGNFTGVRIAVAAARGLALALDVPAIGVSALEAMAFGTEGVCLASLDARQGRLYVQVFGDMEAGGPIACDMDTLPQIPRKAAPSCMGHRSDEIAALCKGVVAAPRHSLPVAIAHLATAHRLSASTRPAPLYLRPADAAPSRDAPPRILP
ncbi:tRNA (adenosine(37)-N6)-threonylcarbamoyltransferase complex dimerization subunit type 1 TsaB [Defluviimonas sp. WL0002]|uniref:tRNA (Adenosine(37)-N6)-threonylcarbamoyltransferase complex dimerization subunit type 1 TsaB n=1 Tax=Albidovulum marisflavi TaxID=2984159 RepID=A0ABT2ZGB3_9RHOB|nr:tRNA (adenosine(37)-N6)-threonylcarbamoyltransferase complex dimerization subunit type 1 TsaB [Defluviimonas sp. WL0002]MCV2870146.1 tRNA (adenosine(37)-N6)-threonylcarbamoyltransferase complex dimerization subunit type 1 TsaB [Defluviimonas sp. WL0002]